jgi:hypothetical protein
VKVKLFTVPTATFLFGSEFEGSSSKLRQQMGVSTRSKSNLSASSDAEDQSSGGSVHSLSVKWNNSSNAKENHSDRVKGNNSYRVKGKKSGNAAKSIAGK